MLIPVGVLVWGVIIYKVIKVVKPDEPVVLQAKEDIIAQINHAGADTFSIGADYRDPFLDKGYKKKKTTSSKITQKKKKRKQKKHPEIKWPDIQYHGVIENQHTSKQIIVLSIDGREHLMYFKDSVKYVHILEIYEDSIQIRFNNQMKTFLKAL